MLERRCTQEVTRISRLNRASRPPARAALAPRTCAPAHLRTCVEARRSAHVQLSGASSASVRGLPLAPRTVTELAPVLCCAVLWHPPVPLPSADTERAAGGGVCSPRGAEPGAECHAGRRGGACACPDWPAILSFEHECAGTRTTLLVCTHHIGRAAVRGARGCAVRQRTVALLTPLSARPLWPAVLLPVWLVCFCTLRAAMYVARPRRSRRCWSGSTRSYCARRRRGARSASSCWRKWRTLRLCRSCQHTQCMLHSLHTFGWRLGRGVGVSDQDVFLVHQI